MLDSATSQVLVDALRVLFLLGIPIVAALSLVSTLVAALQSATSIQEPVLGFGARLIVLVVLLYLMYPTFVSELSALCEAVYR